MDISSILWGFIASYLAGSLPSLREFISTKDKTTLDERIEQCYQTALGRWCANDAVRQRIAQKHFNDLKQVKKLYLTEKWEKEGVILSSLANLWIEELSKEDLEYMAKVFRFISYKTIWRTFESCNNYRMPEGTIEYLGKLEYWYGDKERKERAKDLAYVKEHFLHVKFIEMKNMGHASMATLYPENMAERIMNLAK
jgi:hypothetical protein